LIPTLAGRPFVEKPPGFPAVLATVYRSVGGPSVPAARLVSAFFAAASVVGVFLIGRRALGTEGGVLASSLLAYSPRFVSTAHEILLDNALTATFTISLLFAWRGSLQAEPRRRQLNHAAAMFSLGLCRPGALRRGLSDPRHHLRPGQSDP
jgi:4-amino-4-deoxy-L-arabinose transferase-like glycosyltransferase